MRTSALAAIWISLAVAGGLGAVDTVRAAKADPVVAAAFEDLDLSVEGEAIRELLVHATASDQRDGTILEAVRSFYKERDYEPVWMIDGKPSRQMRAMRRRMERAAQDGLDPAQYVPETLVTPGADTPIATAAAEVSFSRSVARFVVHLGSGSVAPSSISSVITLTPEMPDVSAALARLSRTAGIAAALKQIEPPHPQYARLKATLRALPATRL